MKVSICIPTYNHEKYIAEAIESVLCQQCDFDYELLIGEDDSTDRTREIVSSYKKKYPDKIKLFLNDRKNVIYIDGKPTGRWNFINLIMNSTGQYISIIEGDDYWTSPLKLQKQIDYLDSHPQCVLCGHNAILVYEDPSKESELMFPTGRKQINTIEDILFSNFLPTCSVIFRNNILNTLPDWYYKTRMGDWPLYILLSEYGYIGYIDEVLGIYRIHSRSIWGPLPLTEKYSTTITAYRCLRHHFSHNKDLKQLINKRLDEHSKRIIKEYIAGNNYLMASYHKIIFMFRRLKVLMGDL